MYYGICKIGVIMLEKFLLRSKEVKLFFIFEVVPFNLLILISFKNLFSTFMTRNYGSYKIGLGIGHKRTGRIFNYKLYIALRFYNELQTFSSLFR